jgi:hypothetical protein
LTSLFIDNDQFIYIDETHTEKGFDVPQDVVERYHLALLEWEAVQDELAEIYKAQ